MPKIYGSLTNRLMENAKSVAPKVGEGATILMYSDKHPATIIEVNSTGKRIVIQEDNAIRTDTNGMDESQSYRFEASPNGQKHTASLRRDGRWRISKGETMASTVVLLGVRQAYHDYGF